MCRCGDIEVGDAWVRGCGIGGRGKGDLGLDDAATSISEMEQRPGRDHVRVFGGEGEFDRDRFVRVPDEGDVDIDGTAGQGSARDRGMNSWFNVRLGCLEDEGFGGDELAPNSGK